MRRAVVVTVSDRTARGERADGSGPEARRLLEQAGFAVEGPLVVPDEQPRIAELLRKSGARTLTTASDGATDALRKAMMKGTTREHLLGCAEQARQHGFETLKLYMMLGVPGEEDDDVDALAEELQAIAAAARPTRLALGVAAFVAKRQTPLDGQPFAGIKVVERRMDRLRRLARGAAEVRPVSARWAWIEHALAQGGPEVGLAMYAGWRAGGKFGDYRRALEAAGAAPG